jgi:hypothetical protein
VEGEEVLKFKPSHIEQREEEEDRQEEEEEEAEVFFPGLEVKSKVNVLGCGFLGGKKRGGGFGQEEE